jgi:hypothetical protein
MKQTILLAFVALIFSAFGNAANAQMAFPPGPGAIPGPVFDYDALSDWWNSPPTPSDPSSATQGIAPAIPIPTNVDGPETFGELYEEYPVLGYAMDLFLDLVPFGDIPENLLETKHENSQDEQVKDLLERVEKLEQQISR